MDFISSSANGGNSECFLNWLIFCESTVPNCSNSSFVLGFIASSPVDDSSVTPVKYNII